MEYIESIYLDGSKPEMGEKGKGKAFSRPSARRKGLLRGQIYA